MAFSAAELQKVSGVGCVSVVWVVRKKAEHGRWSLGRIHQDRDQR